MAILDPLVQIKLAKLFEEMWSDFLNGVANEEVESYLDSSKLTEEFELTQEMIDLDDDGYYSESGAGDLMRRLNADGEAVVRLADEANKQAQE